MNVRRANFAAAVFPNVHEVGGLRLHAMTLGHALLLKRLGSPFSPDEAKNAEHEQALMMALVCSRTWRKASVLVNSRLVRLHLKWRLFRRLHNATFDVLAAWEYFTESWRCPSTFRGDGVRNGGTRGTENVHILIAHQRRTYNVSLTGAMDVPVAVAIMDRLEALEENGAIRIWSQEHDEKVSIIDKINRGEIKIPKPNGA